MSDPYPYGMSSGNRMFLDTKGTCFLCLAEISNGQEEDLTKNGETEIVSLGNISRFLKINPVSVLLKSLKGRLKNEGGGETHSHKKKCDFSVMLCAQCSTIVKNISQLIGQIEIVKILLKHELEAFQHVILDSEGGPEETSLWRKLEGRMVSSCVSSVEARRLVEQLRNETKAKCSEKLTILRRGDFPKVQLDRLKISTAKVRLVPRVPTVNTVPSSPMNNGRRAPKHLTPRPRQQMSPKKSKTLPDADNEKQSCSNTTQSSSTKDIDMTNSKQPHRIIKNSETEKLASAVFRKYCERGPPKETMPGMRRYRCLICKNFSSMYCKAALLRHLVNIHPEKFFAHKRTQHNLPEAVFRIRCKRVLKEAASAERKKSISTSKNNQAILCSLCNVKCCNSYIFAYHLVLQHYTFVEDKLERFREPDLKQKHCKGRSTKLARKINMRPRKTRNGKKAAAISRERLRLGKTSWKTRGPKTVRRNKIQHTIKYDPSSLPKLLITPENSSSSSSLKQLISDFCDHHCKRVMRRGRPVRKCPFCPKAFTAISNNKLHLATLHPEQFFASVKQSQASNQEFRDSCRQVLRTETYRLGKPEASESQQQLEKLCSLCKQQFNNPGYLKYHMVVEHYMVLKEKIAQYQRKQNCENSDQAEENTLKRTRNGKSKKDSAGLEETVSSDEDFEPPQKRQRQSSETVNELGVQDGRSVKQLFSSIVTQNCKRLVTGNRYKCLLCQNVVHARVIERHLLNVHPEKFFESVRTPTLSEMSFKTHCKRFLHSESNKVREEGTSETRVGCKYCTSSYASSCELKYHLVLKHYASIKRDFIMYLKSRKTSNICTRPKKALKATMASKLRVRDMKKVRKKKNNTKSWICRGTNGGCGRGFSTIYNLKRHKIAYCRAKISRRQSSRKVPKMEEMSVNGDNPSDEEFPSEGEGHYEIEEDTGEEQQFSLANEENDHHDDDEATPEPEIQELSQSYEIKIGSESDGLKNGDEVSIVMEMSGLDFNNPPPPTFSNEQQSLANEVFECGEDTKVLFTRPPDIILHNF